MRLPLFCFLAQSTGLDFYQALFLFLWCKFMDKWAVVSHTSRAG